MRGWPVHRPTHAPATAPVQPQNNPPNQKPPRAVSPERVKESPSDTGATPKEKTKTTPPSCRHSVAACVSDHSRGQDLPPATALRTNDNNIPTIVIPDIISRKRKENIRNLRRKAGPPTGVAAALSPSDCTGRVALAELREDSFTPSPASAHRQRIKPP